MPQASLAVAQGDTIRADDHNKVVSDVADLYANKLSTIPAGFVTTSMLAAGATSKSDTVEIVRTGSASFTQSWNASTWTDITGLSLSLPVTGGPILVEIDIQNPKLATLTVEIGVLVNGTVYSTGLMEFETGNNYPIRAHFYIPALAAGTYTIQAQIKGTSTASGQYLIGSTSFAGRDKKMRMSAFEFRK